MNKINLSTITFLSIREHYYFVVKCNVVECMMLTLRNLHSLKDLPLDT